MSDVKFSGSNQTWRNVHVDGNYVGDLTRLDSGEWVYEHQGISFLRMPSLRTIADKLDELNGAIQ